MPGFYPMAFWISPQGHDLELRGLKHIQVICSRPAWFGLTEWELKKRFEVYNEPFGFEGNAREEIIRELYPKGFIRARNLE